MTEPEPFDVFSSANKVEFFAWNTGVEDAQLSLARLDFRSGPWVDYPTDGLDLSHLGLSGTEIDSFEAIFLLRDRPEAALFKFTNVAAFRVLDEGGLLQLWKASSEKARPAYATFRVRGHSWQQESPLVWFHAVSDIEGASYMIATIDQCLEVVTPDQPIVETISLQRR